MRWFALRLKHITFTLKHCLTRGSLLIGWKYLLYQGVTLPKSLFSKELLDSSQVADTLAWLRQDSRAIAEVKLPLHTPISNSMLQGWTTSASKAQWTLLRAMQRCFSGHGNGKVCPLMSCHLNLNLSACWALTAQRLSSSQHKLWKHKAHNQREKSKRLVDANDCKQTFQWTWTHGYLHNHIRSHSTAAIAQYLCNNIGCWQ